MINNYKSFIYKFKNITEKKKRNLYDKYIKNKINKKKLYKFSPFKTYNINSLNYLSTELNNNKYTSSTIYHMPIIDKFIKFLMKRGGKSIAENLFYKTLYCIRKQTKINPLIILNKAINNAKPGLNVKVSKKNKSHKGNIILPQLITPKKQLFFAVNWIIKNSKSRKEKNYILRLASEIINTAKGRSNTIEMKKNIYSSAIKGRVNLNARVYKLNKKNNNLFIMEL